MNVSIKHSPTSDEIDVILGGLLKFNAPHFPNLNERKISALVTDDNGSIVGGLTGTIRFTSLHLDYFWLAEPVRSLGYGSKVLAAMEAEAVKENLTNIFVDTYSFQAPAFYEKCGFREVGRYTDFPREGVNRIFYAKKLCCS